MLNRQFIPNSFLQQEVSFVKKAFLKSHLYAGIAFLLSFFAALIITTIAQRTGLTNSLGFLIASSVSLTVGFLIVIISSFWLNVYRSMRTLVSIYLFSWVFLTFGLSGVLLSVDNYNIRELEGIDLTQINTALLIVGLVYIVTSLLGYKMSNKVGFRLAKFLFVLFIVSTIIILVVNIVFIFGINEGVFSLYFLLITIFSLVFSVLSLILSSFMTRKVAESIQLSDNEQLINNFIAYTSFILFFRLFILFIDILRIMSYRR
ncbi:conserved hypothetical membrane protein [Mycoplasmoides gallisepticum str. R(low)]|nr:hypothetical protein [Mycoplasmoides gallisepticum]AAP56540.1 conserved hypothetical membrane protein [Mycoplasmoides gallisepticum str. R(low)]ADC30376.1 conserved hypothetical membrane protein [Mycoplasmoides gallisepticum str. R(high)]